MYQEMSWFGPVVGVTQHEAGRGEGVSRDFERAAQWYTKAADKRGEKNA